MSAYNKYLRQPLFLSPLKTGSKVMVASYEERLTVMENDKTVKNKEQFWSFAGAMLDKIEEVLLEGFR